MGTSEGRGSDGAIPAGEERCSAYGAALASARRVRRRDLALVEHYLAHVRLIASAQAQREARRAHAGLRGEVRGASGESCP
jgi:hypothetical protein